ncbi:MAG: ABC transporter permease subunit [Archaeoglobaceae archaeon]
MNRRSLISILAFLACWEILARYFVSIPNTIFPPFSQVFVNFANQKFLESLIDNYLLTLIRSTLGFILGLALGLFTGLIITLRRSFDDYLSPIATLAFSVPSVAWIPILIVLIGINEFTLPLSASFMCTYPPILYGVVNTLKMFDRNQLDVADIYCAKRTTKYRLVILPQLIGRLIPMIKTEAVMAWKTVFVVEMVVLPNGIGYLALIYASTLRMDSLIAVVLVLALSLILINSIIGRVEKNFSQVLGGVNEWNFA